MNLTLARAYNQWLRMRLWKKVLRPPGRLNLKALDAKRGKDLARKQRFVVMDLETTGLDIHRDRVISVGALRVEQGRILLGDVFSRLCNPGRDIPAESVKVHGITPDMIRQAPPPWEVFDDFLEYAQDDILVAHYAPFDLAFLNRVMRAQYGFKMQNLVVDTVLICRNAMIEPDPYGIRRGARRCSLDTLIDRYGLYLPERHTAMGDALVTALILQRLLRELERAGWCTLNDLVRVAGIW